MGLGKKGQQNLRENRRNGVPKLVLFEGYYQKSPIPHSIGPKSQREDSGRDLREGGRERVHLVRAEGGVLAVYVEEGICEDNLVAQNCGVRIRARLRNNLCKVWPGRAGTPEWRT